MIYIAFLMKSRSATWLANGNVKAYGASNEPIKQQSQAAPTAERQWEAAERLWRNRRFFILQQNIRRLMDPDQADHPGYKHTLVRQLR